MERWVARSHSSDAANVSSVRAEWTDARFPDRHTAITGFWRPNSGAALRRNISPRTPDPSPAPQPTPSRASQVLHHGGRDQSPQYEDTVQSVHGLLLLNPYAPIHLQLRIANTNSHPGFLALTVLLKSAKIGDGWNRKTDILVK